VRYNVCRAFFIGRTANAFSLRRTTNIYARFLLCLSCVFCPNARQRSHLCRALFLGARQRASHDVSSRRRQMLFFAVRREKAHGKDYLPCVVRRGTRQRGFTVQNATVCPLPWVDEKHTAKSFPCVLGLLPCARGARQSRCFP
jgi:hypothetical protein